MQRKKSNMDIWVVVSNIFYFHPYLGKIPILTHIFQMGWNHQPDIYFAFERWFVFIDQMMGCDWNRCFQFLLHLWIYTPED